MFISFLVHVFSKASPNYHLRGLRFALSVPRVLHMYMPSQDACICEVFLSPAYNHSKFDLEAQGQRLQSTLIDLQTGSSSSSPDSNSNFDGNITSRSFPLDSQSRPGYWTRPYNL